MGFIESDDSDNDEEFNDCLNRETWSAKMASYNKLLNSKMNIGQVFTVQRLGPANTSRPWNPSDTYCGKCTSIVRFKVNRPISVVSFGFFGPQEVNSHGKYHMEIKLLTEEFVSIAKAEIVTPVQKGIDEDIFHVKFDEPVPILNCVYYVAQFTLWGPPTAQSTKIHHCKAVLCGDHRVMFRFDEPDSNQLPEINFMLRY